MSKEKQYKIKSEYLKLFTSPPINPRTLDELHKLGLSIKALEEVKPKRVEFVWLENRVGYALAINGRGITDQEKEVCEFMLNDLLPYGVKDKESFNKLAMEWFEYNYHNAQIEFTEYLKLKNK